MLPSPVRWGDKTESREGKGNPEIPAAAAARGTVGEQWLGMSPGAEN